MAVTSASQAKTALEATKGKWKIASWLAFHVLGLPTLAGVVITEDSPAVDHIVQQFCSTFSVDELLLRSDRAMEVGKYPHGGFQIRVTDLRAEIRPFLAAGRTVFLLEPRSPYQDLYSVGAVIWKDDPNVAIEVMGPGFDASDLKLGAQYPHERVTVHRLTRETARSVIASERYRESWQARLRKVGQMLARDIGSGSAVDEPALGREETIAALRRRGETFLLEAESKYQPIPDDLLHPFIDNALTLGPRLVNIGLPGESLMVSASYWGRAGAPIYWDVVWPSLKYEGEAR